MRFFNEFKTQYRLLRQGDACRMTCASDNYQNALALGRTESCEECGGTGFKNIRSRFAAFVGAFQMVRFSRGFRVGIAEFETDSRPDMFADLRRHKEHMKVLRALELYRQHNPKAEITEFNGLPANTRRAWLQRANLPTIQDLDLND